MSFEDVEGVPATQTVTVAGYNHVQIPLQFVKFQNVNSVTVFVEDNQDEDDVRCAPLAPCHESSRESPRPLARG